MDKDGNLGATMRPSRTNKTVHWFYLDGNWHVAVCCIRMNPVARARMDEGRRNRKRMQYCNKVAM